MTIHEILVKIHYLFLVIVHFLFKIANFRKKPQIHGINNPILLDSALTLAEKIRKQKLKSVDVVKAYISRIREVNPLIVAVAQIREEEALIEAKNVDKLIESGKKRNAELEHETPFLGVPFTSKEIINVAGMPITDGCMHRKGVIATEDSEPVQLMKKAGAIPIAVTNLAELAIWPESMNKVYGCVCNPHDLRRSAGGSTGGEGALMSAAGSLIGIGGDIGGSIRIPGCFNGIFGHKPTTGAVLSGGCTSFLNPKVECYLTAGPMCRYATDLLPMMKILSDSNCKKLKLNEAVNLKKLKIYYIDDTSEIEFVTKTHPDVKSAVLKAVEHFKNTYKIEARKLDIKYMQHGVAIYRAKIVEQGGFGIERGLSSTYSDYINYIWELIVWLFGFSKHVFNVLLVGIIDNALKLMNHNFGITAYDNTLQMFQDILDDNSIFLYPTWPEPAPYHNELLFKATDFMPFTGIFNVLKFPSTQCPMGLSQEGLPVGIQVVANKNNDRLTIAAAVELEKAFGGWIPPCSLPK